MKSGTKLGLIIGGVILAVGFLGIAVIAGFAYYTMTAGTEKMRADYRKQTAATVGTLTDMSLTSASKIYTYKYEVNGVSYTATFNGVRTKAENRNDSQQYIGKKATVCYDPYDPNNSDFKFLEILSPNEPKSRCFGS